MALEKENLEERGQENDFNWKPGRGCDSRVAEKG